MGYESPSTGLRTVHLRALTHRPSVLGRKRSLGNDDILNVFGGTTENVLGEVTGGRGVGRVNICTTGLENRTFLLKGVSGIW